MKVELWYDVETTGLDVKEGAAVVQLAAQLVIDGELVESINLPINPLSYNRAVVISKQSMAINGIKEEDFDKRLDIKEAVAMLMDMLVIHTPDDKSVLFGYNNSTFDKYFIEDMFREAGKSFSTYFAWKQIDVYELVKALTAMGILGKTFNQKLGTIADSLSVDVSGELHDALVDVSVTRGIYLKIQEKLQGVADGNS